MAIPRQLQTLYIKRHNGQKMVHFGDKFQNVRHTDKTTCTYDLMCIYPL